MTLAEQAEQAAQNLDDDSRFSYGTDLCDLLQQCAAALREHDALLHYKRVYSEISAILACLAEAQPPSADDEITVQRLKALIKSRDDYADSCEAKAERIDRLGEMVERLDEVTADYMRLLREKQQRLIQAPAQPCKLTECQGQPICGFCKKTGIRSAPAQPEQGEREARQLLAFLDSAAFPREDLDLDLVRRVARAASAQAKKPMTQAQITAGVRHADLAPDPFVTFTNGVRFAEAHHGITGEST